ncbi:MAG: PRC-barrel domain-containing protein [Pseudomonadota bacterium]|nr:PRC-barrel domain-containing protein [Pseudomonadota bacterium]
MKLNPQSKTQQRRVFVASMTAAVSLAATTPLRAATPEPTKEPAAKTAAVTAASQTPARQCLTDLGAFQQQMQKGGYWRGGSGYGYGYPMYGYNYDGGMASPAMPSASAPAAGAYWRARPGYEVRTLLAATQILGQRGQQAACEALLGQTRTLYNQYASDMRNGHMPRNSLEAERQAQLAAAQPVAGQNVSYRADQLIGTEVLDPKGDELGSVEDLVLSPQTGKIAYLVIARGGLFGIHQKYIPVPWAEFKATTDAKLLVLDTTKALMSAAPHVKKHRFSVGGDFDKQSQQVDTYWTAHLAK